MSDLHHLQSGAQLSDRERSRYVVGSQSPFQLARGGEKDKRTDKRERERGGGEGEEKKKKKKRETNETEDRATDLVQYPVRTLAGLPLDSSSKSSIRDDLLALAKHPGYVMMQPGE